MQASKEITYFLQEAGERSSVRSTLSSHQVRSRTVCRSGENAEVRSTLCRHQRDHVRPAGGENAVESDRHYADIIRDHVLSAGGGRTQRSQIDIMQLSKEITYDLQEGGESCVRSTLCSHQKRSRTACRREENPAVRSTFCSHQVRSRTICRRGENVAVRSTFCSHHTRLRTGCRRGKRMQQSQIDILQTSKEITYALQEGGECSSQIDVM